MSFFKVAKVSEIPVGTMKHVEAGGKSLALPMSTGNSMRWMTGAVTRMPGSPGDLLWMPSRPALCILHSLT